MKKTYLLLITLFITTLSFGQIFITEIADPTNDFSARFVELYNAGGGDVDLSAGGGYKLQRYTNGNAGPQAAVALTGTITAGGFYIISPNGTVFTSTYGFAPNQSIGTGGPADSNGDDHIQLLDTSDAIIDRFGVPGADGSNTCHDFEDGRVERIASIVTGNNGAFDEANWNVWQDGNSSSGCTNNTTSAQSAPGDFDPGAWIGAPVTGTTVNFASATSNIDEDGGTIDVCVSITNEDGANATTVDIAMNVSSTATNGTDFTMITFVQTMTFPAASSVDQCLTFTITDDMDIESGETIVLDLQNPGGGDSAALGTGIQHTLTINDNDASCPSIGDIIFTEIMQNPNAVADSAGEYFELHNTTGAPIDLLGMDIIDDSVPSEGFTFLSSLILPANGYLLFAVNGNSGTNGGLPAVDEVYTSGDPSLGNGADGITIQCSGTIIDSVVWSGNSATWPDPSGASMSLKIGFETSILNDNGDNWETASSPYGDGDFGTPGLANNDFLLKVETNQIQGFTVYPNPVKDGYLTINSANAISKSIEIYDILGKQVLSTSIQNNERVNVSNLNAGIYILRVEEAGKLATSKLIIQ